MGFFIWRFKMIAIQHQQFIEILKAKNQAIEIKQFNYELGRDVSIFIQPEHIELFCLQLSSCVNKQVIK